MDLFESVAAWVLNVLPHDRSEAKTVAALGSKRPDELLVLYLNWQNRLIAPRPRRVLRSPGFDMHPVVLERASTLAQIVLDIEQGNELTRHLSRRVRLGYVPPPNPEKKQLGRLQHLDLLLNDWGIHHLHLSTVVEDDGFVERDDPLLFAVFKDDVAYLLDVGSHANFADDRLVHIAVETWPEANIFLELKGVLGSRDKGYSSKEKVELRKAGVASPIQIGEKIYMPPGGLTTAGTSARVSIQSNRILRTLRDFEKQMALDPSKFIAMLRQNGGKPSDIPEFNFTVFDQGFGVIETTSGLPVRLG